MHCPEVTGRRGSEMEWHELKAFLTVADLGSFSRAAEQLHLTQPAVSKRIQRLESSLSTRLFDRVGRRIFLTDAGKTLEPRARELLAQLNDTERLLNRSATRSCSRSSARPSTT